MRNDVLRRGLLLALMAAACFNPERDRLKETTKPSYDPATGRLKELTYDANEDGRIDTWTEMDGTRPIRARVDRDEDGKLDRWEYYATRIRHGRSCRRRPKTPRHRGFRPGKFAKQVRVK